MQRWSELIAELWIKCGLQRRARRTYEQTRFKSDPEQKIEPRTCEILYLSSTPKKPRSSTPKKPRSSTPKKPRALKSCKSLEVLPLKSLEL